MQRKLSRYVHLNPVRAEIAKRAGEYPWSSYRAYVELTAPQHWLHREFILSLFGPDETAGERYRELPALRQLGSKPTLEAIRAAAGSLFADDGAMARRVGMYLCRCHSGLKLKEICVAHGVSESAVTQASRRVAEEMERSEPVRKAVDLIEREFRVSKV